MNNWYSICALNEGAEISIYDEIGAYGVSAKAFLADIGKLPDKAPLTLRLLRGVWRDVVGPEPMPVPPYSRDWGEAGPVEVLAEAARAAMQELDVSEVRTGDVILFRMRADAIAKHVGILSGTDSSVRSHRSGRSSRSARSHFIHAYERTGVIEEHLTPAWQRRIAFAFRFPVR